MYCLRKDHKPLEPGQEEEGPKTKPGANDCQTRRLSYILCLMLKELICDQESEINTSDCYDQLKLLMKEMLNQTGPLEA